MRVINRSELEEIDDAPVVDRKFLQEGAPQAEPISRTDALQLGVGRGIDKLFFGVQDLYYGGMSGLFPDRQDEFARKGFELMKEQAFNDQAYQNVEAQHPILSAIGEAAPNMALPTRGILSAVLTNAGMGGLKYGNAEQRGLRAAVEGGLGGVGQAVGNVVGKAIYPLARPFSETLSNALNIGTSLGLKPRLSQVTGSKTLANMEDVAAQSLGGVKVMDDFAQANQTAANRAAARSIGENSDDLSQKTFETARKNITKTFDDVQKVGKIIKIDQKVGSVAQDILNEATKAAPEFQNATIISLARRAVDLSKNRARIDGLTYKKLREDLSAAAYGASGSDANLFGKLLGAVDDAADRSLRANGQKALADALGPARQQYGNLLALEKGQVSAGGNVSMDRAATVLRQKNPAGFREGRSSGDPLYDLAVFGESFKPLATGSQTFQRGSFNDLGSMLKAPYHYGVAKMTTSPSLINYATTLGQRPMLGSFAQGASLLEAPVTRGVLTGIGANTPLTEWLYQ